MIRDITRISLLPLVLAIFCLPGSATADVSVGGQVTVASDYTFRGVSQTMSAAALQAGVDIDFDNGWYGYAWASNVDFTVSGAADDGARVEVDVVAGYVYEIAADATLALEATAYFYPGTEPGYDYDYQEFQAFLTLHERHELRVGYSDDVYGSGLKGIYYAVGSELDWTEQLSLGIEAGHYDLDDAYNESYSYAVLSLAGELKSFDWQISVVAATNQAESIFNKSTVGNRLTFTLNKSF